MIYWCHLEQIGPKGASLFASSLGDTWGDPFLCLFAQLNLGPRIGLCSRGLRVDPKQTVLLKLDFWYILNNNGFTRQGLFLSPSRNLLRFSRNWNQTRRTQHSSFAMWAVRGREGKLSQEAGKIRIYHNAETLTSWSEGGRGRMREPLCCEKKSNNLVRESVSVKQKNIKLV